MTRFLFTSQPGLGHFHPLVPTALALQARGHEVAFATSRPFSPIVEALEFASFGVGPDWLENLSDPFMREHTRDNVPPFVEVARLGMADDVIRVARDWSPSVIVRGGSEFSGTVAAEMLGIPLAVHGISAEAMWYPFICEPVAALLASFGVTPSSSSQWMYGKLHLNRVPPSFQEANFAASPVMRTIRPAVFDRIEKAAPLPGWVAALGSRPVVYATMGSVFNHVPGVFDAVIAALADEPLDLIITTGKDGQPERFGAQPPNVHITTYLPQSMLLPRCDVVVTHAGFNTVMAALSAGVPLYCLPLGADQPYNALRCVATGVGLSAADGPSLNPVGPTIQPNALEPGRIRSDILRLLSEPSWSAAAQRLQAEILALPAPEDAACLVEQLAPAATGTGAS